MFNNHHTHDRGCCGTSGRRYAGDRLRDAGARWVRGRSLLLLPVVLALALGAQAAAADPVGQVTEFSSGLNAGSDPALIAPGADGNLWFTDAGTTPAIGRITPSGQITEFTSGLNAGSVPVRDRAGTGRQPVVHRPGDDPGDRADHPERSDHRVLERSERRQLPDRDRAGTGRQPVVHRRGDDQAIGRITPSGQITEFSSGLNAGSFPAGIAPGAGRQPVVHRPGDGGDRADHPERSDHRVLERPERGQHPGRDRAGSRTATCGSPTRGRPGRSGGSPRPHRSPSSQAA